MWKINAKYDCCSWLSWEWLHLKSNLNNLLKNLIILKCSIFFIFGGLESPEFPANILGLEAHLWASLWKDLLLLSFTVAIKTDQLQRRPHLHMPQYQYFSPSEGKRVDFQAFYSFSSSITCW